MTISSLNHFVGNNSRFRMAQSSLLLRYSLSIFNPTVARRGLTYRHRGYIQQRVTLSQFVSSSQFEHASDHLSVDIWHASHAICILYVLSVSNWTTTTVRRP